MSTQTIYQNLIKIVSEKRANEIIEALAKSPFPRGLTVKEAVGLGWL